MPVYIGSRFSLQLYVCTGSPEVVQEALADLKIQNYQNIRQTFSKAHTHSQPVFKNRSSTSYIRKSKVIFWSPCDGDDGDEGYDDDIGDGDPLLANVRVRGAYLAWKATPARGVPGSDGSFSALPSLTEPALSNRTRCSTSM